MREADRYVGASLDDGERRFLVGTLLVSLLQGLVGIAKYGYCGQDFDYHYNLLITFPQGFSYKYTNPPAIYALGQAIGTFISETWILELTALVLLCLNTLALWPLYLVVKRIIGDRRLRYAAMLMVTFVPFRVVHALVYSADALTVPIFVMVAWYAIQLVEQPAGAARTWRRIGALMTLGVLSKYTFAGLLPVLAVVALHQLVYAHTGRSRFTVGITAMICLLIPLRVFTVQMNLSRQAQGMTMVTQWRTASEPPEMSIGDLVGFKRRDLELLRAPQYFQDKLYEPHKYSYAGLLHVATFTDVLNYFQQEPDIARHAIDHKQQSTGVTRSSGVTLRSRVAVAASLPMSLLAFVGTVLVTLSSVPRWLANRGPVTLPLAIVSGLGVGFYAPIILNITAMRNAYLAGYWLPRLVMPALVTFLILGFVLLDRVDAGTRMSRPGVVGLACLAYTAVLCLIFISIT